MGFSNKPRGGGKYINFKKGVLVNNGNTFTEFTGILVDVSLKTEQFNGEDYEKLTLHLVDPDDNRVYELGFPIRSGYGYAFFAMSPNLDPSKPMTISGAVEKMENGKEWSKMFISQNDKSVLWHYSKKNEAEWKKIPAVAEEVVGKGKSAKIVKDYTDRDAFIERVIFAFKDKKVHAVWPGGVKAALANAPKINNNESLEDLHSDIEPIDDLPFF